MLNSIRQNFLFMRLAQVSVAMLVLVSISVCNHNKPSRFEHANDANRVNAMSTLICHVGADGLPTEGGRQSFGLCPFCESGARWEAILPLPLRIVTLLPTADVLRGEVGVPSGRLFIPKSFISIEYPSSRSPPSLS